MIAALEMPDRELPTYRGWEIQMRPHPAEIIDTGTRSCWVGKLLALKVAPNKKGNYGVMQPLWLTGGQMEMCRTGLDWDSAMTYMLEMGMKRLRAAIDLYEDGHMQPEMLPETPRDLDPRTDLNDPKLRINVGPAGLTINKPLPPEMPG